MAQPLTYKKLPGKGARSGVGRFRLWAGPDHLLQLANYGYTEEYKRFYFSDIQAIVLVKTMRGMITNLVCGGIAVIGLTLWATSHETGVVITSGIFGFPFAFFFLINLFLGSTCKCVLYTAVHVEPLPSLVRLRSAKKTIRQIQIWIAEAQGPLAPEDLNTQYEVVDSNSSAVAFDIGKIPVSRTNKPITHYRGAMHAVLFSLLLLSAFMVAIDFFARSIFTFSFCIFLWFVTAACTLGTTVKQYNTDISRELRGVVVGAFLYLGIYVVIGYFVYMGVAIQKPELLQNQLELAKYLASVPAYDSPLSTFLHILFICVSAGLGIAGFHFLQKFRSNNPGNPPPILPPPPQSRSEE